MKKKINIRKLLLLMPLLFVAAFIIDVQVVEVRAGGLGTSITAIRHLGIVTYFSDERYMFYDTNREISLPAAY